MRTLALSAPLVPSAFFLVWVKLNHEVKDGRILDRGKLDVLIPPEVLYQDCRFPFATALSLSHAIINKAKQFCPSAAPPGTNRKTPNPHLLLGTEPVGCISLCTRQAGIQN